MRIHTNYTPLQIALKNHKSAMRRAQKKNTLQAWQAEATAYREVLRAWGVPSLPPDVHVAGSAT